MSGGVGVDLLLVRDRVHRGKRLGRETGRVSRESQILLKKRCHEMALRNRDEAIETRSHLFEFLWTGGVDDVVVVFVVVVGIVVGVAVV